MGGRGGFLESGGFSTPAQWHTINYVDGIKVLALKNGSKVTSLPERSNTPGTSYLAYYPDGTFSKLRIFKGDRFPYLDINYGTDNGRVYLHYHTYDSKGNRNPAVQLYKGSELYEKYKHFFKGVPEP